MAESVFSCLCVITRAQGECRLSTRGLVSDGGERGDIEKHKGEDTAGAALIEHTHEITFLVCICIKKVKSDFEAFQQDYSAASSFLLSLVSTTASAASTETQLGSAPG